MPWNNYVDPVNNDASTNIPFGELPGVPWGSSPKFYTTDESLRATQPKSEFARALQLVSGLNMMERPLGGPAYQQKVDQMIAHIGVNADASEVFNVLMENAKKMAKKRASQRNERAKQLRAAEAE